MKVGVFVEKPTPVKGFDMALCNVKNVYGITRKPTNGFYNAMSCFGDNKTAKSFPNQVAISETGRATRSDKTYHRLWDWLCPTNEDYQKHLYNLMGDISDVGAAGVHLYCIGFPREDFCTCPRCSEMWKASGLSWSEWRTSIITDFISGAKARVNIPLSVLLPSEPYTAKERQGIDVKSLEEFVDFFIGILYDKAYATTYWLEDITYSLKTRIRKPLYIQLYAGQPEPPIKNLLKAMIAVAKYADGIVLFTGSEDVMKLQSELVADELSWTMVEDYGPKDLYDLLKRWRAILE